MKTFNKFIKKYWLAFLAVFMLLVSFVFWYQLTFSFSNQDLSLNSKLTNNIPLEKEIEAIMDNQLCGNKEQEVFHGFVRQVDGDEIIIDNNINKESVRIMLWPDTLYVLVEVAADDKIIGQTKSRKETLLTYRNVVVVAVRQADKWQALLIKQIVK